MLEEIIMTRSFNCELIIFAANEGGTLMAANSIYNMHRFGWDHYLLIVSSEAQCKRLRDTPLQISCAWTSFLQVRIRNLLKPRLNCEEPIETPIEFQGAYGTETPIETPIECEDPIETPIEFQGAC